MEIFRRKVNLELRMRALMDGHLRATRATLLEVDFGRWRILLAISAWNDSRDFSSVGFKIHDSAPKRRTGILNTTLDNAFGGERIEQTMKDMEASCKESSSCFLNVGFNPFFARKVGGPPRTKADCRVVNWNT